MLIPSFAGSALIFIQGTVYDLGYSIILLISQPYYALNPVKDGGIHKKEQMKPKSFQNSVPFD